MRHLIVLVVILALTGCSSSQAPPVVQSLTSIAGLSLPDTIDFGVVKFGLWKDINVSFKNTGDDTIRITSQIFSNPSFKLGDSNWRHFNITPGTTQVFAIRYTPTDSTLALGSDTIRTADRSSLMVLRGREIPFSSLFPTAPTSATVTLTGLIGNDTNGTTHPFTFHFEAPCNVASSHNDLFYFDTSYYWDDATPMSHANYWGGGSTSIFLRIDTGALAIDTLKASSDSFHEQRGWASVGDASGLTLHGLKLNKEAEGYSAVVTGSVLKSIVDNANYGSYDHNLGNVWQSYLTSLKGFQDSAKLTILIR